MDRRPAVEKLAWAGRVGSLSLTISQKVEIQLGCAVTVSRLPFPQGSYHAWAVHPLSACSYARGRGTAVGPQSEKRCWSLLAGL